MTIKTSLMRSAAFGVMIAFGAGAAAQAQTAEHHHKKEVRRRHEVRHEVRVNETGAEVRELRDEVHALQARLDAQSANQAQTQEQIQQAQASAQAAQEQVQTAQAQAAQEQAQIDTIPAQVATAVNAVKPKTDKLYYKGLNITLGGFLEAASIYRSRSLASDIASPFNSIPFASTRQSRDDELKFSEHQSRVSALVQGNPDASTVLSMYGEFDFQGAAQTANSNESNSYNPRIRNLYGTIDWALAGGSDLHLLAGQNWSLVTMNAKGISPRNEVLPLGIDAQYVPGFAWTRTPQVRVTGDFMDKHLWLALSAENPQTTFYTTGTPAGTTAGSVGTAASLPGTLVYNGTGASGFNSANSLSINHIPDIVAKAAYETKIGKRTLHIEGFGLYREFSDRVTGGNYNTSGFSGGGSIAMQIVPGAIDAQFSGMAGKGIGRYGSSQLPDVTFRPDGSIAPLDEYMLLAGIITHPTKKLDVFGFAGEEVTSQRSYTTAAGLAYGYGNPLYTNTGCLTEGSSVCNGNTRSIRQVEVGFWQRLYQGSWGRAQVGAQYSHTSRHTFAGVGGAPEAEQDIGFLSFRYYPF